MTRFTSILTLLLFACAAAGQSTDATITGLVTDPTRAVVVGAKVTAIDRDTNVRHEGITNGTGNYTIPNLSPGTYRLEVEKPGFKTLLRSEVVLHVQDVIAINFEMPVGSVSESVTVEGGAPLVNTQDASVSTVVDRQFVANMPLNGRSLQSLIQLTPGVVLTSNGAGTATGSAQFSVNGQRATANYFMVDGVSANTGMSADTGGTFARASGSGQTPGTTALGGTNSLVSLDALQEFRIETSTYAPEFGRTPGGQISLATRGGTNQFHGSASYYLRNEALDANDWFANRLGRPRPRERQHLFGGVFGGPVKRDRVFFFGSYEGLRLEQPKASIVNVPTVALRAQAVPALRPYLNALPLPNGRDFADGTAEFGASYSDPARFNIFALRLDARMTNALTTFFRISHAPSEIKTRLGSLSTVRSVQAKNDTYTGGLTWVAGPRLTSDFRANWTRNSARLFNDLDTFGGAVIPAVPDVFRPGWDPSKEYSFFSGPGNSSFTWGPGGGDLQRQFNTVDTVVWLVGCHQLKFGVDYRRVLPLLGEAGWSFESLGITSAQQVLAQQALFYIISNGDLVPREPVFSNLSLFAQDSWHVGRRLALTYGLRLERVPPPTEANGRLPRTVLGIENDVLQNPRLAPEGTPLFRGRFGEFAPRLGLAYQLGTRAGFETTLRGGVGMFYDLGLGDIANAFQGGYPFLASTVFFSVPFPLSSAVRTPPALAVNLPASLFLLDPNLRLPYTVQWNSALEQALGNAQTVTATYVGAAGRRLLTAQSYSQPLADFPTASVGLSVQRNLGESSYHALQMQYRRRLQRGIQGLVSYTLGRSRDNTSSDNALGPPPTIGNLLSRDYGPSDFDVRHVFSAAITYDIPTISGSALRRASLNGWGLDLLLRYQSAYPVNPNVGLTRSVNTVGFFVRPNLVPGQPLYIDDATVPGGRRFNRAAFVAPAQGQQGNFPRNGLRGFPASQADLALRRDVKLTENRRLQLRGELFNLFNHPNFGAPDTNISSALFGQPNQMLNRSLGGLNALYQMGGPRSAQLAIKLLF